MAELLEETSTQERTAMVPYGFPLIRTLSELIYLFAFLDGLV